MEDQHRYWFEVLKAAIFFISYMLIVRLAGRLLWDVMPPPFRIATETFGAVLVVLWLGIQGYERFLKPGRDDLNLISIRKPDPGSEH